MLWMVLLFSWTLMSKAQNDVAFSVFTVTSKSMTVQWSGQSGATSYKVTATPKNSADQPVFAQFGGSTMMGSVNSLSPNTVYVMQLEAMDNSLNVLSSAETEETTAPEVPSIEKAYSKNSDSITVEFSEVPGATGYILRAESRTGDFFSQTAVSNTPGTIVGLQPYTDYVLSVMSSNAGGRSQPSYPIEARTVVMAPNLRTSSPTNDTINATWPAVEHAVLYTLCVIREGSSTRLKLNTTDTTMIFNDLEAGTTYFIKGTAWDSEGRASNDFTARQITRPPTPDVTMVMVNQGRSHNVAVYWIEARGAFGYTASSSSGLSCDTEYPYCFMAPIECGQSSSVSVIAFNDGGPSYPSEPVDYETYPCPPEDIWVEEPSAGSCVVRWAEVSQVDHYITFIKRQDGAEWSCNTTAAAAAAACSFSCTCGHTFFTSVFPHNQAGSSLYSPVRNYTTIPCCPQDVNLQLISTDTIEIMWSPVKGAELYETTAAQTNDVVHCNDTSPICALSDLECNTDYSVTVTPCSELRGCNHTCQAHAIETAPCAPEILNMSQTSHSAYRIVFSNPNSRGAVYNISATGRLGSHRCWSHDDSCELTRLSCGSTYEVNAVATSPVGNSLPGISRILETGPCCPASVNVTQVTQAMSNVTWSAAKGARSFVATLTSPRGHAKCHTLDAHCVLGCLSCGTSYSVLLDAVSSSGHASQCQYQGFSSSPCCPTGIRLLPLANSTLRVWWRPPGPALHRHMVDLYATGGNYTCVAAAGSNACDFHDITCGDVFTVAVVPVGPDGVRVNFCHPRNLSVFCPESNAGFE